MASSWVSGALKSFFGIGSDTKHWIAVLRNMEETFGEIKFDNSSGNHKLRAFFTKQTLIGDDTLILGSPDMQEAVGTGQNCAEAVIDLWDKMTGHAPHEKILQIDYLLDPEDDSHVNYKSFKFTAGIFVGKGQVKAKSELIRPDYIETFINHEKTYLDDTPALPPPHI